MLSSVHSQRRSYAVGFVSIEDSSIFLLFVYFEILLNTISMYVMCASNKYNENKEMSYFSHLFLYVV